VTVAVLAGAAILFPSLALLFRLVLSGGVGRGESQAEQPAPARPLLTALAPGLLPRLAIACLVAGIGFLTVADAAWAHTLGVFCLFAFIVAAFPAALPPDVLPTPLKNPGAEKADPR
jgi:cytochrome d ubiquinol oxidase subunit II